MLELAERGGETANLAVLDHDAAIIIEQVPSPRPCRFVRLGSVVAAPCTPESTVGSC